MPNPRSKQHIPIFVGSTFEDMKEYRRATLDALTRLETVARGMEYFGSLPGEPVDECLAAVRSCKIYIGIFGMRYGSIPDPEGSGLSMTHLEYEEARRIELPSLLFLLDAETQPILPKFVDTGPSAEKLARLKQALMQRHVCSSFTTPDDLAAKVTASVHRMLAQVGAQLDETTTTGELEPTELLSKFEALPLRFRGREIVVRFRNKGSFSRLPNHHCEALMLDAGSVVYDLLKIDPGINPTNVFAEGELAEEILELPAGAEVSARTATAFGSFNEARWTEDGVMKTVDSVSGLLIREILAVKTDA